MRRPATTSRTRRGAAVIEFALTLPFLLLVAFAIIELSLVIHHGQVVGRAARDGGRIGAHYIEGIDPTGDEIKAAAIAHATYALQTSGIDCETEVACTVTADWFEDTEGWMMLAVEVSVPYRPFTMLTPMVPDEITREFITLTQQQIFD